ncbi:MAG: TRAP transporter large permease [Bacilli bacterium]|nr:TRAP transporter large permease [Bacilli bacterium]
MFFEIELLYFILMIAVFVVCMVVLKIHAGLSMMISAVVGMLVSGNGLPFRHLIEGTFGYLDTILVIVMAMVFMQGLEDSKALNYISMKIVEKLHKKPILMLLCFMLVLMFPGMITGSSVASVVSSGVLLAPIMIKLGIPKVKVGAIIAFGAIFGMIAPPINVPVMVICDIVDMPYIGFALPLLLLSVPLAFFTILFLGYRYVKVIDYEAIKGEFEMKEPVNWTSLIPLFLLIILILLQNIFPMVFGVLGLPLVFTLSAIATFFFGKKFIILQSAKTGVYKSFGAIALLMGVGMFIQTISLNGVRGYFVLNAISLPGDFLKIASMLVTLPLFGGVSAFGSASVLGGPFVMSLLASNQIVVASTISMIASTGEFLPPTAMSASLAAKTVEEPKYLNITKASIVPLAVTLGYCILFLTVVATVWK